MKKIYFLLFLIFIGSVKLSATTYTSAQNGNWMTPTTWSPIGIPVPGDIIVINKMITLDTSFAYTTGSILISSTGSLLQDLPVRSIWLNGVNAAFTNNGTVDIQNLLLSAGSFTNSAQITVKAVANFIMANNNFGGTIMSVDSLYNDGTLNNNGTINVMTFFNNNTINNYGTIQGLTTVVDSMYNAGTFLNDVGALLKADSCTNSNTFTNNGVVNFDQFTNIGTFTNTNYMSLVDMTNIGTFTNQDSLIGAGSITNTGNLDNQAGALIDLSISFLNVDTVNANALLTINGVFNIGDSYYNFNGVTGTSGSITVQDTSYNSGAMTGSYDFCDATPPATSPYIDINTGTVDPTITYCMVGVETNEILKTVLVYPNPTNNIINIDADNGLMVEIYNLLGEQLLTSDEKVLDISGFEKGIYLIVLKDLKGNLIRQERIIKE